MSTEESSELPNFPIHSHHHNPHLFEWLEETIPSFLEEVEPYSFSSDLAAYDWWAHPHDQLPDPLLAASAVASPAGPTPAVSSAAADPQPPPALTPKLQTSKKRKLAGSRRRNSNNNDDTEGGNNSSDSEIPKKPTATTSGRKTKNGGSNSDKGNKEVRWAEQLLNPLASAIEASNLSRVQHLLYVLQELASPTGDANHRLAAHGYRALTHRLPAAPTAGYQLPAPTFSAAEPKLFRSALIKFQEFSPWFAFPNSLANASILQTLAQGPPDLHVVDVGVSHGIQWPTLLEALTRRQSGAPPLVRLTVAGESLPPGPFSAAPPGYDFPSHLLRYAKSIELNLQIDKIADLASLPRSGDETLVVCAQFRVHHGDSDQRSAFLKVIRELDPDLLIFTEIDGGGGGGGERERSGLGFASEFAKRSEILWRFLDSTSAAFKGRDCVERRVMEGEMARVLEGGELGFGEGREKWREKILGLGFTELGFGEEAVEAGRALLRKYDGNWEMRPTEAAAVGLWWKGQPVSFCSIWKTANGKI